MVHDDRFPIAAQLFIRLKRSPGRVIDVTWMLENEPYAREVLKLARTIDAESAELASRFEALAPSVRHAPAPPSVFNRTGSFQVEPEPVAPAVVSSHYVGTLR